ncbi:MAG: glycine cleavage system protein [Rhodospirillales bacterium]|nr:glycine cleavage system protein [Rhodospirillales bacterium]
MQSDDQMSGFVRLPNRGFLRLSGPDRLTFLQGLVSNDVNAAASGHAVYACLLTPQGKFLHDFFLIADGESLLIDCEADRRGDLAQRLKVYKLRSKIEIAQADYAVYAVLGAVPAIAGAIAYADPRVAALGSRIVLPAGMDAVVFGDGGLSELPFEIYDRLRIARAVPDGSRDMEIGKAILLENNIDLLNGVAWDKGCYTGQELTARTRYRGLIKKRLVPVTIGGAVPAVGTPLMENGMEVGEMRAASGDIGLALIRLERLRQPGSIDMAGTILTPELPDALAPLVAQTQP